MTKSILHIGYAKAGSTFLQNWFQMHPQLQFAPKGIGGYNSAINLIREAVKAVGPIPEYFVTSYENLGAAIALDGGVGTQELNYEGYGDNVRIRKTQKRVCDILHILFPDSKIIIATRGYESILRSGYSEYVKEGGELQLRGILETNRNFNLQWLDIDYVVNLYSKAFGKKNLIVLPYELLRDDQSSFLRILEERLEIDHFEIEIGRPNPSLNPRELLWYARMNRIIVAPLARILGKNIGSKLYMRFSSTIIRKNRLLPFIRLLNSLFKRKTSLGEFPPEYLDGFRGQCKILEHNPLYADYLSDYLLDS